MRCHCIVESWLTAWGIEFERDGDWLTVEGKSVAFYAADCLAPGADVTLHMGALLARNFDRSMRQVEKLMKVLGRKMPPLARRPTEEQAAPDDYLGRSMRLRLFSQTPNPSEEAIAARWYIVKREADRACRRFRYITDTLGLEQSDFYTLGRVFLTIYLHRFQDLNNSARNKANLTLFLHQCFSRWAKVTRKDMRSIIPDARGVLVHQVMAAPVPGASLEWSAEEPFYTMPEYVEQVEAASTEPMDPREARKAVTKALAAMEHDEMVEKLAEVMRSAYLDHDTRRAATLRFNRHLAKCEACRMANEAWQHVQVPTSKYNRMQSSTP